MEIHVIASGSSGNCYSIVDDDTIILIDPGISFHNLLTHQGFDLSKVKAVLVSHEHEDHCKAVKNLQHFGIPCYMSAGTASKVKHQAYLTHYVKSMEKIYLAPFITLLPFDVVHDAEEPLGFILMGRDYKLMYAVDTAYVRYRFNGLTHIMVECNFDIDSLHQEVEEGVTSPTIKHRLMQSHLNLDTLKEFLASNDLSMVEEIVILHTSRYNADKELIKQSVQEITGKYVRIV
jgi:phosphoribosyl 1,2-cyclic phosphodiesterase